MKIDQIKRPWIKNVSQGTRNRDENDSFYHTSEWKRVRAAYLRANPYCQDPECGPNKHEANMVDHITRIKAGGSRTDFNNLQGLCNKAHARKSAREANEAKRNKK